MHLNKINQSKILGDKQINSILPDNWIYLSSYFVDFLYEVALLELCHSWLIELKGESVKNITCKESLVVILSHSCWQIVVSILISRKVQSLVRTWAQTVLSQVICFYHVAGGFWWCTWILFLYIDYSFSYVLFL